MVARVRALWVLPAHWLVLETLPYAWKLRILDEATEQTGMAFKTKGK